MTDKTQSMNSIFKMRGFKSTINALTSTIQDLYRSDEIPWVIGYSGGKDSTAVLQLIWNAVLTLPDEKRHKVVHVISTDTLVENPVVAAWVTCSLELISSSAKKQRLPIEAHRLTPELKDRFWVNMIGRGYPAPRPKFRWCTERLKINPSNNFIMHLAQDKGEVILVLGTRKAESQVRAANMDKYSTSTREQLSRHGQLDRSWIFTPIAEWSNDDVWQYLMQVSNPWGCTNRDLLGMYQGASADGECPLVIDTSTPSCGDSRFGCFVCTMVTEDKSMKAMILNDSEKQWMLPLLEFRNQYLGNLDDRHVREFRRMNGTLLLHNGRLVHGPYTQDYRENMLRALLEAELTVRKNLPPEIPSFSLISLEELSEIRRIWVEEKREIEDRLPVIYEEVYGMPFPGTSLKERVFLQPEDFEALKDIAKLNGSDAKLHYELVRDLIGTQLLTGQVIPRSGLLEALDKVLETRGFANSEEALQVARTREASNSTIDQAPPSLSKPSHLVNIRVKSS